MRGLPLSPSHVKHWDHCHSRTLEIAHGGLAVQVIPHGACLAVDHRQHPIQQAEYFEGQETVVHERIEPDPRAALDSISDEERSSSYVVINDVMIR